MPTTPHAKRYIRMLELGAKFLISYFIGSLMGSMIVGRLKGGVDIRSMGSGNAGFTNALRTQGIAFAVAVVIIDIGKGVIGAGVVPELNLPFIATDPTISRTWLTLCCATASVMGHVWPMYHHFRGGKGAAALAGTLIILSLNLIAPLLLLWVVVLVLSGYVGLATMTAAVALPVWLAITQLPAEQPLFIYSAAMAAFIIYCHHSNIQRMRDGSEHRNTQLMLFRRRGIVSHDEQD